MKISVALATYNGELHIESLLRSLAEQDMPPDELVVCDDASEDGTWDRIIEFARAAPFPVVHRRNTARLGYVENFLSALRVASGDVIAFCDQDDVWFPRKVLCLASAHLRYPAVSLVSHSGTVVDESLRSLGRDYPAIERDQLLKAERIEPWRVYPGFAVSIRSTVQHLAGVAYERKLARPSLKPYGHDGYLCMLAPAVGDWLLLEERLVMYRQHSRQLIGYDGPPMPFWRAALERNYVEEAQHLDEQMAHLSELRKGLEPDEKAISMGIEARLRYLDHYRAQVIQRARLRTGPHRLRELMQLLLHRAYRAGSAGGFGHRALAGDLASMSLSTGRRLAGRSHMLGSKAWPWRDGAG